MSQPLAMNDPGDRFFLGRTCRGLQMRPYRDGDERRMTARADFAADFAEEGALPLGPKWTLVDGPQVRGVGGAEPLGKGVWGGWAYLAELRPREWLFAAEVARLALGWVRRRHRPQAVQAVAGEHPGADRLLRHIGFEPVDGSRLYLWRPC